MHWYVGIDEAGYGSSLGPFVMAFTAVGFESKPTISDYWSMLSDWVFDHRNKVADSMNKLGIGDSKQISRLTNGLQMLGAPWRTLFHKNLPAKINVSDFLESIHCINRDHLKSEPWWNNTKVISLDKILASDADEDIVKPLFCAGVFVLGVNHFNSICELYGSKGAVTSTGWVNIVKFFSNQIRDGDRVEIFTDQHGGRNRYSSLIEKAFEQVVLTCPVRENNIESRYRPIGTSYELEIIFAPKGEGASPLVAMASMLAKHLREESMNIFNEFWVNFFDELRPTAGYPNDAKRFVSEIAHLLIKMNIPSSSILRIK
jgi:ribonuclease HII